MQNGGHKSGNRDMGLILIPHPGDCFKPKKYRYIKIDFPSTKVIYNVKKFLQI